MHRNIVTHRLKLYTLHSRRNPAVYPQQTHVGITCDCMFRWNECTFLRLASSRFSAPGIYGSVSASAEKDMQRIPACDADLSKNASLVERLLRGNGYVFHLSKVSLS